MIGPYLTWKQKIEEAYFGDAPSLDLDGYDLNEFPDELWNLTSLKVLNLEYNNITSIPREIVKLKNLETLNLRKNKIEFVSPKISWLPNLERLILQKNKIKRLPNNLNRLERLRILDLRDNQITHIPIELGNLNLQVLDVFENPVENIPVEIIEQGTDAILNYLLSKDKSEYIDYLYEAKLVIVGRGGRGKTSLVRKLTIPNYCLEKEIKSTEGIDIQQWDIDIKLEKSNSFRFNLWDFGGQEKYDATHQFFLTERSLYFFLTDARQEDNYLDFDYWLNVIRLRSKGSPVIVIQNKIDERVKELPQQKYKALFPDIQSFSKISCADGWEYTLESLKTEVRKAIMKLPQVGDELPKPWVDVRKELETLSKEGINYLSLEEYTAICKEFNLSQKQGLFLSQYYHDLGIIVHHKDDVILRNTVIINPDWAVDGVYNVLDTHKVQDNNGEFTDNDLLEVWSDDQYKDKTSELLQLMKNYELCFQLGFDKVYIAPELLLPDKPQYEKVSGERRVKFQYHYDFLPSGIITRFIVRIHSHIEERLFWRYGVVLSYENSRAEVVEDNINRKIYINVVGPERKELLGIIRMEFKAIHKTFHGLNFQEMIPIDDDNQYFKSYAEVKVHAEMDRKIFVWELRKEFDANDILAGVTERSLNKTTLKRKVANGELESVIRDIQRVHEDNNIIIAQLGRINKLKQEVDLGIIDDEKGKIEENKVRKAILELIDEI